MNPFVTKGAFSWFELMTTDIEGAKKFYGEVFDWNFEDSNYDIPYTHVKIGETKIAGIFNRKDALIDNPDSIPPHWGNYVTVTDILKTVYKVEDLGGKIIVEITRIPKIGDFAVIQDPQGAVISIMQYLPMDDFV